MHWLVGTLQDDTKNTGLISKKLYWRMENGSRKNLLCVTDVGKGENPGILIQSALAELVCAVLYVVKQKICFRPLSLVAFIYTCTEIHLKLGTKLQTQNKTMWKCDH